MKKYKQIGKQIVKNTKKAIKKEPILGLISLVLLTSLIFGAFIVGFFKAFLIVAVIAIGTWIYLYRRNRWYTKYGNDPVKRKKRKKRKNWLVIIFLIFAIVVVIGIGFFGYYIVKSAPNFEEKKLYSQDTSIVYDSEDNIIAKLGREKRQKKTFDELPQVLIDAVIATEDSRYFQHNGFDLPRFTKASMGQVMGNSSAGGGSTITMQVVKNTLTSTNQTIIRKFTDIYLAVFVLEKKYTKEQIFELYVNIPFLGANSYGVEEASQTYFRKSVSELNLSEAALIAGLFQSPSSYNPYSNPELAEKRRDTVLYLMKLHGYITEEERALAKSISVKDLLISDSKIVADKNPYQAFVDTVVKEVEEKTGTNPYDTSMKIYTTMNKKKQDDLNDAVNKSTFKDDKAQTGIAVTNTKDGSIAAIYGGRNRNGERTYNYATDIVKQIGSTAKPIYDYGPGVEYLDWNELTPFTDEPWAYSDGVSIKNWDGKYNGKMNMKTALGLSRNIPALKAYQTVGHKKVIPFVKGLGMAPEINNGVAYETHAVGAYTGESPLKMAAAYAAFGNGGYYIKPYSVTKIVYISTDKETVYKPVKTRAMSDSTAYIITDCLMWSVNSGIAGTARSSGVQVAGKSGTTNYDDATMKKYRLPGIAVNDLWMIAYSPSYSVAVWYGYDEISTSHYAANGHNTNLLRNVYPAMLTEKGDTFTIPTSVKKFTVEKDTNPLSLPSPFTPAGNIVSAWFKVGTEPTEVSQKYSALNNVTNLEYSITGSSANITWKHSVSESLQNYVTKNTNTIGELGYNVYKKSKTGSSILLGFTTDKNYKTTVEDGDVITIKSTYSLSRTTESSGTSSTISTISLNIKLLGDKTLTIATNPSFKDVDPGIEVTDNDDKIIVVKPTLSVKQDSVIVDSDTFTKTPGTYQVTYIVTHGGKTVSSDTRIVIVTS